MRRFVAALALLITPGSAFGQAECVDGMVIIRLVSSQAPATELLTASPPLFGLSSVDEVLAQYSPTVIRPFLASVSGVAQSPAVDRLSRTYIVYFSDDESPHAVVAELLSVPAIEAASVNERIVKDYAGTKRVEPSDTEFANQWNLDNDNDQVDIDAPEAWAIERGDANLVIGIIDFGTMVRVDDIEEDESYQLHSDNTFFFNAFEDNAPLGVLGVHDLDGEDSIDSAEPDTYEDNVIGRSFVTLIPPGNEIQRRFWRSVPHNWLGAGSYEPHGVWVASIAAAKADSGDNIAGIANRCKVYTLRDGTGVTTSNMVDEADAILHAADFSRVINMSWSFPETPTFDFNDAIFVATHGKDCVLVASAGNCEEDDSCTVFDVLSPGKNPSVLCVGSISPTPLERDSYSRYGPTVGFVDLVAPVGAGIPANSHDDQFSEEVVLFEGTSAAAPQAAGVAALVRSRFPGLTQDQVRQRMKASAEWY